MPAKVTFTGPLFVNGQVQRVFDEIRDDIANRLATEGERRILSTLDASLKKPTGAYRRRVTRYGAVVGQARVHDQQCVYGPWLNGTGSRNRRSTFKGYGHFKKTHQVLQRAAKPLARQVVAEHLTELGG